MKRKAFLFIFIWLIAKISAAADIIPDPIVAKGIIPRHPVDIQMVSELVNVNLTLDSAFVECTFQMHNFGKKQDLEVGFPIMNFYQWNNDYLSPLNKNKFDVIVKGAKIDKVNIYIPDELKKMLSGVDESQRYNLLREYSNLNKPWYLWKVHFGKQENLTIVVKYRLPNGATKSNMFFDYLLSTGAGWKGKIEDARVIVNLDNIPKEQILNLSPKHFYKLQGKRIEWHFKNLKPTLKSDILVEYEREKGANKAFEAAIDSVQSTFIDGKKSKHSSIDTTQVGSFELNWRPNHDGYEVIVFTKKYILQKFKDKIKETNKTFWKKISHLSAQELENSYSVEIDGQQVSNNSLFEKLNKIDTLNTLRGEIRTTRSGKKKMVILSNKRP